MKTLGTVFSEKAINTLTARAAEKPVFVSDRGEVHAGRSWQGKFISMLEKMHLFNSYTENYRSHERNDNIRAADVVYNTLARQYGADVARETTLAYRRGGGSGPLPLGYKPEEGKSSSLMTCGDVRKLVNAAKERSTTVQINVTQKQNGQETAHARSDSPIAEQSIQQSAAGARFVESESVVDDSVEHINERDGHDAGATTQNDEQETQQGSIELESITSKEQTLQESESEPFSFDVDEQVAPNLTTEETTESAQPDVRRDSTIPNSAAEETVTTGQPSEQELPEQSVSEREQSRDVVPSDSSERPSEENVVAEAVAYQDTPATAHAERTVATETIVSEKRHETASELSHKAEPQKQPAAEYVSDEPAAVEKREGEYSFADLAELCRSEGRDVTPRTLAELLGKTDASVDAGMLARYLTQKLHGKDNLFLQDRKIKGEPELTIQLQAFMTAKSAPISKPKVTVPTEALPKTEVEKEEPVHQEQVVEEEILTGTTIKSSTNSEVEKPVVTPFEVRESRVDEKQHAEKVTIAPEPAVVKVASIETPQVNVPRLVSRPVLDPIGITVEMLQTAQVAERMMIHELLPKKQPVTKATVTPEPSIDAEKKVSAENLAMQRLEEAVATFGQPFVRMLNNIVKPALARSGATVEFRSDDPAMETDAYYIPRDNIIAVKETDITKSQDALGTALDNILFESFNAEQKERYLAAATESNPLQQGKLTADIEYQATLGYIKEVNTMSMMNMHITPRAQRALSWAVQTLGAEHKDLEFLASVSGDDKTLHESFLTSPHDKQAASGETTMPTTELYQYQAIKDMNVKEFTQLLKEMLPKKSTTAFFATKANRRKNPEVFLSWVKNVYPAKTSAEKRPAVALAVLTEAEKVFGNNFSKIMPSDILKQYIATNDKVDIQSYRHFVKQ